MGAGLAAAAFVGFGAYIVSGIFPANVLSRAFSADGGDTREVLDRYCVGCHNSAERAGGITLDGPVLADATGGHDTELWEHVVRKVRTGFMPPAGEPRPEGAVLDGFAAVLERRLDRAARLAPHTGFKEVSRLNRAEYANAVRDLLAFDAREIVAGLPADDAIQGFDNVAAALTVSPTLIDSYVNAALKISRAAVGDRSLGPTQVSYEAPGGPQTQHVDGLPLGTRGGFKLVHAFPLDATYELRVRARGPGALSGQRYCPQPAIDLTLDGAPLALGDAGALRLRVTAGPHTLTAALLDERRCEGVNELYGVYAPGGGVQSVEIHGPFEPTGTGDTPSRRAVFSCYPSSDRDEEPCAREILTRLATQAYRRPASGDAAVDTLLRFYEQGRREGGFETGIEQALARLLVDPRFLYRFEAEPDGLAPGEIYRVSDFELASRLSFFLWSSIPDEELLAAAAAGGLHEPAAIERQVRRMLADPRAAALIENFAGQWLKLRELDDALPQDPGFDGNLRQAFRRETELSFGHLLQEDRSVLELLDARYAFLDERLARHYGIDGVRGSHFRRVELSERSPRGGLLGHGSILTATSVADRTSPVIRGQWIVENLLGVEVPPPPPGVEADLSDASAPAEARTIRQRMERHRSEVACASCHQLIDPFGFALEHFDSIGRWRDHEAGEPIDATASLVDGTAVDGPTALRDALLMRSDAFVTAFTEKLMTYALGRILTTDDRPAVRRIVADAAAHDYRFSSIVLGIANSPAFQMQTKRGANTEER
jgi:mono/diheme cytochrome c family protein